MAKTYNNIEHTHFSAPSVKDEDGHAILNSPTEIAFVDGKRVWFVGEYPLAGLTGIQKVSDYDDTGCAMMTIEMDVCAFWTSEEADGIERCIDADEQLLRYARG